MSEALLRVENLSIGYDAGVGQIQALRAANLEAHGGEVIGIVGESGCGKSTLVAALINLLAPNAHVNSGTIYYKGTDILTMDTESQRHLRGPEIAMVFQDPMTTFNPVITMGDQLVDFQHHIDGISNTEKRKRAGELLARVGIPDPELCLRRYPHELSGGMRQRASIAAALLMTPNVLVADEPTTALDVTMEAQIIHLLRELRTDYQGAIIVVTHHLGVVAELCDRVYVMYAGQVVEQGLVDDIYHAPKHPYTRALIACDPAHFEEHTPILPTIGGRVPNLLHPPHGCSFADRCSLVTSRCREMAPPWVRISENRIRPVPRGKAMTALLDIAGLSVNFPVAGGLFDALIPGRKRYIDILDGISLSLKSGETLGLVGESGSGKTTLARAILGLSPISAGTIAFNGAELRTKQSFANMRRSSAMMFQDPVASLSPRMSVGALLTEPFIIHRVQMQDRKSKAEELLSRVGLSKDMANRYPHELSGGQARRVGVARALALHPKLVIADEPTAGLDVSVQGEILNLMTELKTLMGLSYMIITHNLAMVRHVSDRIAVMYLGRLIEVGPTREVFKQPLHPYAKSLIASEPQPDPRKRRADLAIKGEIPSVLNRPRGCEFHTRCSIAQDRCRSEAPQLREIGIDRIVRCHFAQT